MDEARRVLERLERIEALRGGGAGAHTLLPELRALVAEGEAWVAAEGAGTSRAGRALAAVEAVVGRADAPREGVVVVTRR